MNYIEYKHKQLCNMSLDINEHLPTLANYASKCESVIELGVRGCISSWSLILGLLNNGNSKKKILLNDIVECNIEELLYTTKDLNITVNYEWKNDLELELNENYDMVFIDTWHVYGQLKRELAKFSPITNKYIIMHDTEIDSLHGETIRLNMDKKKQSIETGIPEEEITRGLKPAIYEFLESNPEWKLIAQYSNNNGLTILGRVNNIIYV